MSYLSKMYGRNKPDQTQSSSDKNPNRVTGGLRAQGVDRFTMISEDGTQQEIPTVEYVRSLEEQSKKQRAAITVLERKLARQESAIQQLAQQIKQR
jgi:ABC-type hemin transport system substrate-binding protein